MMRYFRTHAALALAGLFCLLAGAWTPLAHAAPVSGTPVVFTGIVEGPDAKPVAGATIEAIVSAYYKLTQPVVKTDAAGRFRIEGEKRTSLEGEADGMSLSRVRGNFAPRALIAAPDLALVSTELKEGENHIRLQKGTTISGLVNNERGEAVAGAVVRLRYIMPADHMQRTGAIALGSLPATAKLFTAQAGADGRWTMAGLPREGNASIELDDPRYVRDYQQISLSEVPSEATPMIARPGTKITGRILFEGGTPAPDVSVTAGAESGGGSSQAITGPDGSYTLYGLSPGTFKVRAMEASGAWVAPGLEGVTTQLGNTTRAPDLILGHGIMLEGQVTEADTGKPIAGASIAAQGAHGSTYSTPSDEKGRYTLRAVPGSLRLYFYAVPEGFVSDRFADIKFTATPAQKTIPPVHLKQGLVVRGTAFDEEGEPATGAIITTDNIIIGSRAVVDENGDWVLKGIDPTPDRFGRPGRVPGALNISAAGEWQIVTPATIPLPANSPVQVVLRRIQLAELEGRVVTPGGEAVPGVVIKFKIALDSHNPTRSWTFQQKTTDAQGRYRLSHLRPEHPISLSADKTGYSFVRGGLVEMRDGNFRVSDVVLAPMQAQVSGQVLDKAGKPVPEARVTVVGSKTELFARTNAKGNFTLQDLPEGALTILAAHNRDFGHAKAVTGRAATITLAPGLGIKGRDLNLSVDLITQWVEEEAERDQENAGSKRTGWQPESARRIARLLGGFDPDLAVRLAAGPDGVVEDRVLAMIVARLAQTDPARAGVWAPAQIGKLKPGHTRTAATLNLGLAVAESNPVLARQLMDYVAATMSPTDFSSEAASKYALLAALAGKLNDPQSDVWLQSLQVAAQRSLPKERYGGMMGAYAETLARGSARLAENLIVGLEPLDQIRALERIIPKVARYDVPAARTLHKWMEELAAQPDLPQVVQKNDAMYRPTPQQSLDLAAESLARALAPSDPQSALELARKIKGDSRPWLRPIAMATAARHLKGEAAVKAFREAVAAAGQDADTMARIAAFASATDPVLAEEFFQTARERLARRGRDDDMDMRPSYAAYAFYRASIDAAESRLLLEREWTQRIAAHERALANGTANSYSNVGWRLGRLAQAMAAVDLERAVTMAQETFNFGGARGDVRPLLINYLLASEEERRTMPFDEFLREEPF